MHRRFPALLLLLVPLAPLAGQARSDRPALDRFRDSLAAVTDTNALRLLQRSLDRQAPAEPLAAYRAALAGLRRAELGADPGGSGARDGLRRLTRRRPDWPYAWHALALAEVRRAEWERADALALGNRVGTGTLERAMAHERRALQAEAGFLPAALALADLALGLRDTALYAGARDALRQVEAARPDPPAEVLLALGRLERATDEGQAALATFARAAAAAPSDAGRSPAGLRELAGLELARTGLALGDGAGEAAYFEAAASDEPWVVAGYRADLVPIASGRELARFDATSGAARAAFLRRFWDDRDRAELRGNGERLREHFRRLLYARRHFALTIARRFFGARDAYRSGSEELDDRGVVYVRHGDPAVRLHPFVFGLMPNETWRYGRADGDLLFHFSAGYDEDGGGDLYDYRLVESVMDLHGASDAPVDQLLLSRETLTPLYGRMLNWGPNGAARARARERGIGRVSIDYGTTTDSYELQFARGLTAYANLIAVGFRDALPLAHFVFAIGARETTPVSSVDGAAYPVRVRVVALDGAEHAIASADTIVGFHLGHPLAPGQYLIGRVELPVPAGNWTWRAALSEGADAGVVLPRDTVRVAAVGPALSLSDLVLGVRDASVPWHPSASDTVYLTPFDLFREGSELALYYEGLGASPGTVYRHEIAVFHMKGEPAVPDRRPVVSLSFEEKSAGPVIRSHRTLQLRRLRAGTYLIEVRVRGPDGVQDTRRRAFRVTKAR